MFAIRARRKVASERDFLDAVEKVVRQGTKFSSTFVFLFLMKLLMIYLLIQALVPSIQLDLYYFPLYLMYFEIDGFSIFDLSAHYK